MALQCCCWSPSCPSLSCPSSARPRSSPGADLAWCLTFGGSGIQQSNSRDRDAVCQSVACCSVRMVAKLGDGQVLVSEDSQGMSAGEACFEKIAAVASLPCQIHRELFRWPDDQVRGCGRWANGVGPKLILLRFKELGFVREVGGMVDPAPLHSFRHHPVPDTLHLREDPFFP